MEESFPPKIFSFKYKGTEYGLGSIPLGGFVKITGIIDESMDTKHLNKEPEDWEFRSKPPWQRLTVMLGGIIFNVITGLIKANIPTRIGFQVSSKIDSRTILDQGGAEQLLGYGDMLYLPPGVSVPVRVHGAFVGDDEVHRVVDDWKKRSVPDYIDNIVSDVQDTGPIPGWSNESSNDEDADELYDEAVNFVIDSRRASISAVQRKLRIGYNRAARLIETMEQAGIVTEMSSNGSREVIVPKRT